MKGRSVIASLTVLLAACSMTLSPEQSSKLDREYRPVVNTFIPECIAAASGKQPNYAAIRALGYTQRNAMIGSGVYLAPAGKGLLSKEGIKLVPGKGCFADHDGISGVAMGGLQETGQVWVRALEAAGYQNTSSNPSSFSFVANGVKMNFYGTRSDGTNTFSIRKAD
ncbi:hypothetical protein A6J80_13275 [Paracoccus yeei]|uniref:Lipoprotein n=1 Tax=Paracoccus yeei TaxID=147645 RepID=A0A1V0GTQ5_9RHOB|nr:hypothetical protein [Paracoccus yeei]ARC37221.1 hypothetical protein A6J80_13275 [Paracoccus yeei]